MEPASEPSVFPDQPMHVDERGTTRFVANRIVRDLVDGKCPPDLNEMATRVARGVYSKHEMSQLTQLIGYSVSGWGDLSYHHPDDVERCDDKGDEVYEEWKRSAVDKLADLAT